MYNNNQAPPPPTYPNSGYHDTYPQYSQQQEYSGNYGYQGYSGYSNQAPQPPTPEERNFPNNSWTAYKATPKDAVAQEMLQQKAQLIRQREDYVKKTSVLKHELEQLQVQRQDLLGNGRSPDMDLSNILQQNAKLQEEIQGKMKAIHNVIEMLSGIIKDGKSISDLESTLQELEPPKSKSPTPPPPPTTKFVSENTYKNHHSPEIPPKKNTPDTFCYVHYDTGLHWCRMCDAFPETAKDFLLHLQDKSHREMMKDNDLDSTPWHKLPAEPLMPSDEGSPQKRVPIKGLQFFIAAPSWYCKLCDVWIGDLHCASQHLKSKTHYQNYENFVGQNPHWEMEWIKDREKSMSRQKLKESSESESDKKHRKRKDKQSSSDLLPVKDKKKKKRSKAKKKKRDSSESSSSSSSSDSSSDDDNEDRSRSIRVAMRNMQKVQSIMDEDYSAKWNVLEKLVEEHKKKQIRDKQEKEKREMTPPDDPLINQWMTVSQPPAKDKLMFDSLKDRMRQKHEQERARLAEQDKIRREREREDRERLERRKREEKEAAEEAERLRKRREQEELDKIKDKDRHQVRFKPNNYRRTRRSHSRSDDEEDRFFKYNRRSSDREGSHKSRNSRSRSRSRDRRSSERRPEENNVKKKPPGPPSYKKLPFIGRMPLFKNKASKAAQDDKEEPKEIMKRGYEIPRKTRFEPGTLPRAFIPRPDVVCFPKLSSIPPLSTPPPTIVPVNLPPPPPAPSVIERVVIPDPPMISRILEKEKEVPKTPKAPPPPKLDKKEKKEEKPENLSDDEVLYGSEGANPSMMGQFYPGFADSYPNSSFSYQNQERPLTYPSPPHSHSMPLQPPPLPPDDDLAMLGICADDMAAQSF